MIDPCVFITILLHFTIMFIVWTLTLALVVKQTSQYNRINEIYGLQCSDRQTNEELGSLVDRTLTIA